MGVEKEYRPVLGSEGFLVPTETVALSTAVQTLAGEGVSFVTYGTSGDPNDAIIPAPFYAGQQMTVVLDNQTTSLEANFNTATTAAGEDFFGSTFNTITVTSTINSNIFFSLTAASTAQWALTNLSSTVDFSLTATTGSTGQ